MIPFVFNKETYEMIERFLYIKEVANQSKNLTLIS